MDENFDPEPELEVRGQGVNLSSRPGSGMPRCPQCGSTRVRRRIRPLVFNVVALAISLLLTPVFCAMSIGVLVSLSVLPLTTCIAIVGRSRCLDCRHRFESGHDTLGTAPLPRFPWHFHVLNIVILFALCIAGPHVMRMRAGAGGLPDVMTQFGLFFMFGFLLWGSLLYHPILFHSLRRRIASPAIWAVLFLLPGIFAGGKIFYESRPISHMHALMRYAGLAPLPASASGVRYYTWSSPFSGEDFMRFTADANDIKRFLADSPALQGQEPERFWPERMRLKNVRDSEGNLEYHEDANEYFSLSPNAPRWYKQEIRGPARRYRVQPPRYQLPGHLLVDDETNTVYIYLWFS